jgi:D-alanyl-D-alanine carboxypeptidase
MKKIICLLISIIFILTPLTVFAIFEYEDSIPTWSNSIETFAQIKNKVELQLTSEAAILMDENTGTILYTKNEHAKLRPASVTKVMTILLIMEALERGDIKLEDKVPCSERARKMGGSQIWLAENETLSVHEMLKAICVVSANDRLCCNVRVYIRKRRSICRKNECTRKRTWNERYNI